jgi:penicillin-binding protein 2
MAKVEERRLELPGVLVEVEPQRVYPTATFAAHLLGYVREVSEEQLRQRRYRKGDLVGQSGIERLLDELLRGRDGGEQIEVDALGRPVQVIRRQEPHPGAHVITTLDRRIQGIAERALGDHAGAIVVLDPRNGDVLAMVSRPAFELGRLTGPLERDSWLKLVQDPHHPLLNRAIQGQYAPGSVFKLVVAAAALQERVITPFDRLRCGPDFQLGKWVFRNWEDKDWGDIDLYHAIVRSCNTFFYQLGLKVGIESIARYAKAFGFGQPTTVPLPGEKAGLIPSPAWRRERQGRPWHGGDTVTVSIGQGQVLVTPLQIARFMGSIANGGIFWAPRLIQRVESAGGELLQTTSPHVTGRIDLSPVVFAFLQQSLWGAVNEGGTGAQARLPGIDVAGKTGTAQTIRGSDASKGQDHAWFAGFAPRDDARVVVVVFVERGGKGGQVAAPIAREVFQGVFFETVALAGVSE